MTHTSPLRMYHLSGSSQNVLAILHNNIIICTFYFVYMQHVPMSLWSEQLFRLTCSCCLSPGSVGFSPGDIATLETLPQTVSKKKKKNINLIHFYGSYICACVCIMYLCLLLNSCVGGKSSESFWVQFEARSQIITDHSVVNRTLPWKVSPHAWLKIHQDYNIIINTLCWCWSGMWLHFVQFLWFNWSVASWSPWWHPSNQGSCSTWQYHKWVTASTEVQLASTSSDPGRMF